MKMTNNHYIIQMTKDFIDGNIDYLTYHLDYSYELISRWDKMNRESAELADILNFYLFEKGFDTVDPGSNEASLRKVMRRQYKELLECLDSDIY